MQAVIIFLLIIVVLLVIFTLQNATEISVNVFFWEITNVPVVLVIIGSIIIGYILATIYYYPFVWKLKRELRRLKNLIPISMKEDENIPVKLTADEKGSNDLSIEGYSMDEHYKD
ncbi:MAG: LapA family protein [Bacteroidales bacterium]|jgi:uncharacterized integral membrane protein|nr:LapA family protein [Bacteroidales bacterium]